MKAHGHVADLGLSQAFHDPKLHETKNKLKCIQLINSLINLNVWMLRPKGLQRFVEDKTELLVKKRTNAKINQTDKSYK